MGILKERNEVGPLLLKLGVALAISFAGFLYTHFIFRAHTKHRPPSSGKSHPGRSSEEFEGEIQAPISIGTMVSEQVETVEKGETVSELFLKSSIGDESTSLLPEFSELVLQEFSISGDPQLKDTNFQVEFDVKKSGKDMTESELEIKELRDQVCVLQERERSLQMQLLEYYGLKEQENAIKELESHLKMKSMESKIFELKAQSLQVENQRLQDQVSNYSNVVAELESARKTMMLLGKQMKTENGLAKAQLAALHEHVSTLQVLERQSHKGDKEIQKKLQRLHDLENETTALRKMNERLQQENMELVMKLESGKTTAADSNSEVPQIEVMDKTLEETNELRESNKKLVEEIERLRMDRCADAEELVYLRWINACLRYELRNFQVEPGRSMARNLSKSLSPKSEEKAKKLIIEYACSGSDLKCLPDFDSDYYSPSSTITDTGEFDDSPVEARSAKTNNSSKNNLFQKLRRLVLGKHSPPMGRNSGSWSDWDRSVSKSLADEMPGPYLGGSFSSTATVEYISPAILSDVRSKSLRIDPVEVERITKKGRYLVDSEAQSRSMSDIPRGRHVRIRPIREDISAKKKNFITTDSAGEILENIQKEKEKIHGRQISSEKVELLKFAEVLGSSRRQSMDYKKQGFSSF